MNGGTPNAGTDINLSCGSTNFELAGNNMFTGTLNQENRGVWSMVSGPGPSPLNASNFNDPTPLLTNLVDGVYVFRYSEVTGSENCPGEYDDVTVVVSTIIPSGVTASLQNTTVCAGGIATMVGTLGDNGASGVWTLTSSSPTDPDGVVFSPSANALTVDVSDLEPSTTYTFNWAASNSCGSSSAQVSFTTTADIGPSDANITTASPVCLTTAGPTTAGVAADVPAVGTGAWSIVSQPAGATASFTDPSMASTTLNGVSVDGVYTVVWTVTNGPCPEPTTDTLTIFRGTAEAANGGSNLSSCVISSFPYTTSLGATAPTLGTGQWSMIIGPSTVVFANPTSPTTSVTFPTEGNYVLAWTIEQYGCSSSTDLVYYDVGTSPYAHAGDDQSRCGGSGTFTLDAYDVPSGTGSGEWTVVSITAGATVNFSDKNDPNATVTLSNGGTAELQWSTYPPTGGICPAKFDRVIIDWVAPAFAGNDDMICEATSTMLIGAVAEPSSTITWTQVSGPNTATIAEPNNYQTAVSGLITGTYQFRYTKTTVSCGSYTDDVTITVHQMTAVPNAGTDVDICDMYTAALVQLNANTPPGGTTGTWSITTRPFGSTATLSNVNDPMATLSPVIPGNYVLRWTFDDGICQKFDEVVATVDPESCTPSLCGTTWQDANTNGLAGDPGDEGVGGITVQLYTSTDVLLATTRSLADGTFAFLNVPTGDYYLQFDMTTNTPNIAFVSGTHQNMGSVDPITDTGDSDIDPNTYKTAVFSVVNGTQYCNIDAGFSTVVLPVELMFFKGSPDGCNIKLDWATASEENNAYFIVEHSIDGRRFTQLSVVQGAGNSTDVVEYQFTHENVRQNLNHYRLKQVDNDGSFEYSKIVTVRTDCYEDFRGLTDVYPNPTSADRVKVKLYADADIEVVLEMTDVAGRLVKSAPFTLLAGNNIADLNIGNIEPGIYFITVKGGKWRSAAMRLVKVQD
jgi:hypothetical protein